MNFCGRLNRRELTGFALAIGVGGGMLQLVTGPADAAAWTPDAGVRLAGPAQGLAALDPARVMDLETILVARQVSRGLVGYDDALLPVPELAASMDVSGDGLTYTFVLREDARFHDGRAIEAEDVRFSFTRALRPGIAGDGTSSVPGLTYLTDIAGSTDVVSGVAEELAGVEAIDSQTVRVTLSAPSSTFPMKLAAMPSAIVDRLQDMTSPDWWTAINGSGPYRVDGYDDDGNLHLVAVDSWFGEPVPVPDVTILLGMNAAQPVNLFQGGNVDLVADVPPALVSLVSDPATGMQDAAVHEESRFALAFIAFGNQNPPLDDPHIRRALQLVFPADRFAEVSFDGRVRNAEGVIPPGMLGREWPAEMPKIDAEAARVEVAASGYGSSDAVPPIRIHAADIAPVEALRDVAAAELGLVIEAVQVNWGDFLGGLAAREFDAYSVYWGVDYPDPEALLHVLFGSDSPDNYTGYRNPAFDDALAVARAETDQALREQSYDVAQQVLIDDAAVIPLYVPVLYVLARDGMTNVPVTPMGLMGLEKLS